MIVHQTAHCGEITGKPCDEKDVGYNGDEEVLLDIVVHETNRRIVPRLGDIHNNFVLQDDPDEEYQYIYPMKFVDFISYKNLQEHVGNILSRTTYFIANTFESLQKDITDETYKQFNHLADSYRVVKSNSKEEPIVQCFLILCDIHVQNTHSPSFDDDEEEIDARIQSLSIEDAQQVPRRASKASIDALEKQIYVKGDLVEICTVCREEFFTEDETNKMPCSHTFHKDCLEKWLEVSHVCPLCRFDLPTDDDSDSDSTW